MNFDCAQCDVRHLTLYGRLPGFDGKAWASLRERTLTVPARKSLLLAGQVPPAYYVLRDGWAFHYVITPGGARQILWFSLPGEAVAPLIDRPVIYSVGALTDCSFCVLDRNQVLGRLSESSAAMADVMQRLYGYQQLYSERIAALGKLAALEKIANLLRHLQVRLARRGHEGACSFDFPLRNSHVGDALGMTPVHVSRVFAELRSRRVVERHDRQIQVLDQGQLDELARVSAHRLLPLDCI